MDLFEKKSSRIAFFTLVPLIGLIMILIGEKDFFFGLKEKKDLNNIGISQVKNGTHAGGQVVNCLGRFFGDNGKAYYAVFGGYFSEQEFIYILETDDAAVMRRLDALAATVDESTIMITANGRYKKPSLPVSIAYNNYLRSFPAFSSLSESELNNYAVPMMLETYEYKGRAPLFIFGALLLVFALVLYVKYRREGFSYDESDEKITEKPVTADISSGMPVSDKSMASFMALQDTIKKLSEQKAEEKPAEDEKNPEITTNSEALKNAESVSAAVEKSEEKTQEAEKKTEHDILPAEKILAVKEYIAKAAEDEKNEAPNDKGYYELQDTLNRLSRSNPDIELPVLDKTDRGLVRDLRLTPFSKAKDPREGKKYADLQDTLLRIRRENPDIGFLDPPEYFYEEKLNHKKSNDLPPLKRPEVNLTEYLPQPKSFEEIVGLEPKSNKGNGNKIETK